MKRKVFITALAILAVTTLKSQDIAQGSNENNGMEILAANDLYLAKMFHSKFLEYPTFRMNVEPGSLNIDPAKIIPIGENGYLYPAKKLKGDWGKLSSNGFVMFSKDWKYLMLTIPRQLNGNEIQGDDWTLTMKDSYYILRNQSDRNFYLIRG
ncbi:MAG: hypothetical protein R6W67_08625 [Bacteroidales bacterium]